MAMTIGTLARQGGVGVETVRYYQRRGLLAKSRIAALDEKIAELEQARDALKRLARDCGAGAKGPCPIILAFEHG